MLRNHFEEPKEPSPEHQPTKRSRKWRASKIETDKAIQDSSEEIISEKLTQIKRQLKEERVIRKFATEKGEGASQPRRTHSIRGELRKTKIKQIGVINIEDEETSIEEDVEENFDEEAPEIDPAQQEIYNYVETLERKALESRDRTLFLHCLK